MALKYHNLTDEQYRAQRYLALLWLEEKGEEKETLYRDAKGFPTIGVGFKVTSNWNDIFDAFGINWRALPGSAEYNYIQRIKAKFYTDTALTKEKTFTTAEIATLQSELNAIMSERAGSDSTKHSTFSFNDSTEIEATFQAIAKNREDILDAWLATKGLTIPKSNERITLLSLVYNNVIGPGKSPSLLKALAAGNRAEAWFEIRYNSNKQGTGFEDGIAKRRYYEADYFDLYEAGTLTDEEKILQAKTTFRMYTINKDKIISYDTTYGAQVAKAKLDYNVSWVKSTSDNLKDAKDYLITNFATNVGMTIDGEVIVGAGLSTYAYKEGTNVNDVDKNSLKGTANNDLIFGEKGNDTFYSGAGNDVIYGGEGNDKIKGGEGNDYIEGGSGNDIYYINTGEGTDTIEDKEGKNTVIINGTSYTDIIKLLIKQTDGSYKTPDGKVKGVKENTDMVLYDAATGEKLAILNKDFQDGDFGIHLLDTPAAPKIDNVITGSSDADDNINGTSANDKIELGGGDDTIGAYEGGNDWIDGGAGRDAISTGYGSDVIEGGAGSDIIFGSGGDDQVFGENSGDMETLITNGETATSINEKGDLVAGNDGNDMV